MPVNRLIELNSCVPLRAAFSIFLKGTIILYPLKLIKFNKEILIKGEGSVKKFQQIIELFKLGTSKGPIYHFASRANSLKKFTYIFCLIKFRNQSNLKKNDFQTLCFVYPSVFRYTQ